jgi:hypothetical protein
MYSLSCWFINLLEVFLYQNVLSDTNMKYPPCIFLPIVINLLYNLSITFALFFYVCIAIKLPFLYLSLTDITDDSLLIINY